MVELVHSFYFCTVKQTLRLFFAATLGLVVFSLNAYLTVHYFTAHTHDHDHGHGEHAHAHDHNDDECPVCEFEFAAFLPTGTLVIHSLPLYEGLPQNETLPVFIPRFRADLPDLRGPPMS